MSSRRQSRGGQGGGQGGPSTMGGKTASILAGQRQTRAAFARSRLSGMINTIKKNIPDYTAIPHTAKDKKRQFCSYEMQVFELAAEFLEQHVRNNNERSIHAYDCLGILILVCVLDRVHDIWTTSQVLNQTHQSMLLRLSILSMNIFVTLLNASKKHGTDRNTSDRYSRLMSLAGFLQYLSSLDDTNIKNRKRDQLLVHHIRNYVLDLKQDITSFFNALGRGSKVYKISRGKVAWFGNKNTLVFLNSIRCNRLRWLLDEIEKQRSHLSTGRSKLAYYKLGKWLLL